MTGVDDDGWRCPRCGSGRWGSASLTGPVDHGGIPIRQCTPCGHYSNDRADRPYTPPAGKPRAKSISVGVDEQLLDLLEADATEHGRTVTQTIRFLVRQALVDDTGGNATRKTLARQVRRLKRKQMTQGVRIQEAKAEAARSSRQLDELLALAMDAHRQAHATFDQSEGTSEGAAAEAEAFRAVCVWILRNSIDEAVTPLVDDLAIALRARLLGVVREFAAEGCRNAVDLLDVTPSDRYVAGQADAYRGVTMLIDARLAVG